MWYATKKFCSHACGYLGLPSLHGFYLQGPAGWYGTYCNMVPAATDRTGDLPLTRRLHYLCAKPA